MCVCVLVYVYLDVCECGMCVDIGMPLSGSHCVAVDLHFTLCSEGRVCLFSAISLLIPGWLACKVLDDSLVFAIFFIVRHLFVNNLVTIIAFSLGSRKPNSGFQSRGRSTFTQCISQLCNLSFGLRQCYMCSSDCYQFNSK